MNFYDLYTDALEKVASELDQYRHLPLPKLHGTLKGLRKKHEAASQQGLFNRIKNRSQNKERGRHINALGSALAEDPFGPRGGILYRDSVGEEDFLTPKEVHREYQKERPEDRAMVASTLAENVSDRYSNMVDGKFHGARGPSDEHYEAGMRLRAAQRKPGGAQLADAYMKKHFSGGHKKVAARSRPNFQDALKSHATRGFTSMPDGILEGRKRIKAHDVRAAYAQDGDFLMPGEKHLLRYTASDIADGMTEDAYKRISLSRAAQKHHQAEADRAQRKANSAFNRIVPGGTRRKAKHLKRRKGHVAQINVHGTNIGKSRQLARLHDDTSRAIDNSGGRKGLRLANDYMKKHFS